MEKEIGIPILTPHELRHTYGTLLRENGVDIYTIQKVMGHSDISVTIPVPNSNTKTHAEHTDNNNQYNSNIGRCQTMQRYRPYIFFSEVLFSFRLRCLLSSCYISLHTV